MEALTCGPESRPDPFEIAEHLARLEVLAAVERHVLDEMRQAQLIVALLDRPGLDGEAERHALLGARVLPDVELEAVGQRARPDGRVERQDRIGSECSRLHRARRLLRHERLARGERQDNKRKKRDRAGKTCLDAASFNLTCGTTRSTNKNWPPPGKREAARWSSGRTGG